MNIPVLGMTGAVIIMFLAILVMYTYVNETRENQQDLKETQKQMNASINTVIDKQIKRVDTDNIRFNATLKVLGSTYEELQSMERQAAYDRTVNTQVLANISEKIDNNTARNLNLTKFNRATLVDSNHMIRELAEKHGIPVHPFNASRIG